MNYQPQPLQLLPTNIHDGRAPGLVYHIQGELVPVLSLWLDGAVPSSSSITLSSGRILLSILAFTQYEASSSALLLGSYLLDRSARTG